MVFEIIEQLKDAGCIIRDRYHIYCPGCGGTRALEELLRGHPMKSIYYNPAVFLLLLIGIAILIIRFAEHRGSEQIKYYKMRMILYASFLAIWFVFWIARNYLLIYQGIDMLGDFY